MCFSLLTLYHERDTHSLCDDLTGSEACRNGSRGPTARIMSGFHCVCFAPGGKTLFEEGVFTSVPRSTLLSHQIQRPLSEFGSPPRVSSPQRKGSTLRLSFSEEGDREDVDEFSQNVRLHKHVVINKNK